MVAPLQPAACMHASYSPASPSKTDIGLNECIVSNHSPSRKLKAGMPGFESLSHLAPVSG